MENLQDDYLPKIQTYILVCKWKESILSSSVFNFEEYWTDQKSLPETGSMCALSIQRLFKILPTKQLLSASKF